MESTMTSPESQLTSDCFNPMDRHLARVLLRYAGTTEANLLQCLELSAGLVSRELADGHSCICLGDLAGKAYPEGAEAAEQIHCPELEEWVESLRQIPRVVGKPGERKPLILDHENRLYLHRYWSYEQAVAQDLRQRSQTKAPVPDPVRLKNTLNALFPPLKDSQAIHWQKVAAFAAAQHRVSLITGGPGTGKTWTVARVLAALLQQPGGDQLRVKLAAPTGKAAARLQESIAQAVGNMECDEVVKTRLRADDLSTTLHRLLGVIPHSPEFRHNRENPLPLDVLIVDEASMIGLSLMTRLLAALTENTRLILVGDKDQLPPVDPGSVFGDFCAATTLNQFSPSFCEDYQKKFGGPRLSTAKTQTGCLADAAVQLQVNHRSGAAIALNHINQKVNQPDVTGLTQDLAQAGPDGSPVAWRTLPEPSALKAALQDRVLQYYQPVLESKTAEEALTRLGEFRILCAVREGPYGVENVNRLVEEILKSKGAKLTTTAHSGVYPGKPVMVTANNYTVGVFNGDIGVFWPADNNGMRVHFPKEAGRLQAIARERLPENETVYAMTVHKSQGSEFKHVLLILPDRDNPVLTRELIYTGLTRAKESVSLLCGQAQLETAVRRTARRNSGLPSALKP